MSSDGGGKAAGPPKELAPGKHTASTAPKAAESGVPGKQTLTAALGPGPATAGASGTDAAVDHEPPGAQEALAEMGSLFGRSFSDVRIHAGPAAHDKATSVGSRAYTQGRNIYFARGAFKPYTEDGRRLLAHELTHVVQQSGATAGDQPTQLGERGDRYEQEAHRGADAVLAGQQPVIQESAGANAAMRDEEPVRLDYQAYMTKYATQIVPKAMEQLAGVEIPTQCIFTSWKSGSSASLVTEIAKRITAYSVGIIAELPLLCAPGSIHAAVDRGRGADATGKSDDVYHEAVSTEVANLLIARITESVKRLMPRYAHATNTAFSQLKGPIDKPNVKQPPDPTFDLLVMSAPIDKFVGPHLMGKVRVDLENYRDAHPNEKPVQKPRIVEYTFAAATASSAAEGKANFIEVTTKLDPPVTAEDVALTLFGSPLMAAFITPAPPLWGFRHPEKLLRYAEWKKLPGNTGESDPASALKYDAEKADPAKALLSSKDADKAALGQSAGVPGTEKGGKGDVAARMAAMKLLVDGITSDLKPIGINIDPLTALHERLEDRSKKVLAETENKSGGTSPWDGQSAAQRDILMQCANGAKTIGNSHASATAGAAGNVPRHLVEPIRKVAAAFLDAAAVSDLAETGTERLAHAKQLLQVYPIDVVEGILSYVRQLMRDSYGKGSTAKGAIAAQTGKSDAVMQKKEQELRNRCALLRTTFDQDPAAAFAELQKIQNEVKELQHFATVLALVGKSEELTDTLDQLSTSFAANWALPSKDPSKPASTKKARYDNAKNELNGIKNLLMKTVVEPAKNNQLQASYDALPALHKAYQDKFKTVSELIESQEAKEKWIKIGILIGAGIVSGGLADVVAGPAGLAATELGISGTALTAMKVGTEAIAFTAITQTILETEHSVKSVTLAFFQNVVSSAMVAKAMATYQAGFPGFSKTFGGTVVGAGTMFLPHCVGGLVAADAKKFLATGKHLDHHEMVHVVEEAVLVTIGTMIGERVAHKFLHGFKPHMPHVKKSVEDINAQRDATKAKAAELAAGGKKPEEGLKVVNDDSKTIKAEEEVMKSKEIEEAASGKGPHSAAEQAIAADTKAKIQASLEHNKLLQLAVGLRHLGGDNYVADGSALFDNVRAKHFEAGHEVTTSKDHVTENRIAVVKTKGENPRTIRIIEDKSGHQGVMAKPEAPLPRTPGEQKGVYNAIEMRRLEAEYQTKKQAILGKVKHEGGDDFTLDDSTASLTEVTQKLRELGWTTAEIVDGEQVTLPDGTKHKLRTARFEAKPDVYGEKPPYEPAVRVIRVRETKPPAPQKTPVTPEQWTKAKQAIREHRVPSALDLPHTPGNLEGTTKLQKVTDDAFTNATAEGKKLIDKFYKELSEHLDKQAEPIQDLNATIQKIIDPQGDGQSMYLFQGPKVTHAEAQSMGQAARGVAWEALLANGMVTQSYYEASILPVARKRGIKAPDQVSALTARDAWDQCVALKQLVKEKPPMPGDLEPTAPIGRKDAPGWWGSTQEAGVANPPPASLGAGDYSTKVAAANLKDGGYVFTLDPSKLSGGVKDTKGKVQYARRPLVFDALWNPQWGPNPMGGENWGKTTPDPSNLGAQKVRELILPTVPIGEASHKILLL